MWIATTLYPGPCTERFVRILYLDSNNIILKEHNFSKLWDLPLHIIPPFPPCMSNNGLVRDTNFNTVEIFEKISNNQQLHFSSPNCACGETWVYILQYRNHYCLTSLYYFTIHRLTWLTDHIRCTRLNIGNVFKNQSGNWLKC